MGGSYQGINIKNSKFNIDCPVRLDNRSAVDGTSDAQRPFR